MTTRIENRRAYLLDLEGAGPTPCLTAAHNWLECRSARDEHDTCLATGKHCCMAIFNYARWCADNKPYLDELHNQMLANRPRPQRSINPAGAGFRTKKVG